MLVFADDIVLQGKNKTEMTKQIKKKVSYLENVGMHIGSVKCSTFQIATKNKTLHVKNPEPFKKNKRPKNIIR